MEEKKIYVKPEIEVVEMPYGLYLLNESCSEPGIGCPGEIEIP